MSASSTGTPRKAAPKDLGPRGRAFWRKVQHVYEIDLPETELLIEACRALDECEDLAAVIAVDGRTVKGSRGQVVAHPALAELRATRQILGRLLAQMALPAEDGAGILTPLQTRARRAAQVRWSRDPRRGTA